MSSYFLGIDVGGTKTHAALVDETGHLLAFHTDTGGNPEVTGFSHLADLNQRVVSTICADAGILPKQISAATFGIAGFDWPSQMKQFYDTTRVDDLTEKVTVTNDTILGLVAGASEGWGVCLVAGTSFNCRGLTMDGREGRVIGDGLLWDEGAGSLELATYAIQAVAAEWSKRGMVTRLTDALLKFYGYDSIAQLIEDLVLFRRKIDPDFAQAVIEVAKAGDEVANTCVRRAAHELASLAAGVIQQLSIADVGFDVVLAGSMFKAGDILINPLAAQLQKVAPRAKLVHLQSPPVAGAVMLAMQREGHSTQGIRDTLLSDIDRQHSITSTLL